MQRRFRQFPTPYDAWWHHRRRLRTARRCALLTALLLPGIGVLLHGFPHHAFWRSEGDAARFIAVPYTTPEQAEDITPTEQPTPRPALRAPLAPPPAVLALFSADILPAPTEEQQTDIPQEGDLAALDIDIPVEEECPITTSPRRQVLAAASPATATTAKRTPPAYRDAPKPPYPAALRARRISGSVGVRIAVSAEGLPTDVSITTPSGHAELDRSARSWILAHWRFRPAELDGKPIAAHVQTRIDYELN